MAEKRKTTTSNEVKKRYADKTFCTYKVMLRKAEDADLIAQIENLRQQGTKTSDAFKEIMCDGYTDTKAITRFDLGAGMEEEEREWEKLVKTITITSMDDMQPYYEECTNQYNFDIHDVVFDVDIDVAASIRAETIKAKKISAISIIAQAFSADQATVDRILCENVHVKHLETRTQSPYLYSLASIEQIKKREREITPTVVDGKFMSKEYCRTYLEKPKKYEILMDDSIFDDDGHRLFRIRAICDFGDVKAGQLGGYVMHDCNLSQKGDCWIYDNARAYDFAIIQDSASLHDHAEARGAAKLCGYSSLHDHATVTDFALMCDNSSARNNAVIEGNASMYDDAVVLHGNVSGDLSLRGNAEITSNRDYIFFGSVSAFRCADGEVRIARWRNLETIEEYVSNISTKRGADGVKDNDVNKYLLFADMIKKHFDLNKG